MKKIKIDFLKTQKNIRTVEVIYMKLIYGLLFAKVLNGGKVNPKKISKTIKRESKFWIKLITKINKHYIQ